MNSIWIPVSFTVLMVIVTVWDLWDDRYKFQQEWAIACLALAVKPGLLIVAVWAVWLGTVV